MFLFWLRTPALFHGISGRYHAKTPKVRSPASRLPDRSQSWSDLHEEGCFEHLVQNGYGRKL